MPVRRRKGGSFYHYEFWIEGVRYYGCFNGKKGKPLAKDRREAIGFEAVEYRKALQGVDPEKERLKDFCYFVEQKYMPFALEHHSEPAHDQFRTDVMKEYFKGKQFSDITTMLVEKYIRDRLNTQTVRVESVLDDGMKIYRRRSPTTVHKEIVLLSAIFNMAMQERVATENPCNFIRKAVRKKIPARIKRERYLTLEEEQRLFSEGLTGRREHLREITLLALLTGMRRGELLRLKWEHINFGETLLVFTVTGGKHEVRPGWLLIEQSKNGKPRLIPMSKKVKSLLESLNDDATNTEYVFRSIRTGLKITEIKRGFTSACTGAEIDNLTFHDLRHTWSTRAADCGVIHAVRRDILGHSSVTMTDDYTQSTPEARERAMELVASYGQGQIFRHGKITARNQNEGDQATALSL